MFLPHMIFVLWETIKSVMILALFTLMILQLVKLFLDAAGLKEDLVFSVDRKLVCYDCPKLMRFVSKHHLKHKIQKIVCFPGVW